MAADLTVNRGPDRIFCTADDDYRRKDVAVGPMVLTTETANTVLRDADNIRGVSLERHAHRRAVRLQPHQDE